MTKLLTAASGVLEWLGHGFQTVIPEAFIIGGALAAVVVWLILRRFYQRCPHCRRPVSRARTGTVRCPRCGRQYYHGLRHVG